MSDYIKLQIAREMNKAIGQIGGGGGGGGGGRRPRAPPSALVVAPLMEAKKKKKAKTNGAVAKVTGRGPGGSLSRAERHQLRQAGVSDAALAALNASLLDPPAAAEAPGPQPDTKRRKRKRKRKKKK
ncbi:hypothetical protein HDV64DRAFT_279942 [Trichoderma sp. TUCIM 5745]